MGHSSITIKLELQPKFQNNKIGVFIPNLIVNRDLVKVECRD